MRGRGRTGMEYPDRGAPLARGRAWLRSGGAAVLLGTLAAPVAAQSDAGGRIDPPTVTVTAGAFVRTDFRAEGSAPAWGVRFRFPLGRWLAIEPAIHATSFEVDDPPEDVDDEGRLAMVDFQLQLQWPRGMLRPYLGVGAGGAADFRDRRGTDDFVMSTFTGSVGVHVALTGRLHLLAEARARSLDEFSGGGVGLHAGVGWRF